MFHRGLEEWAIFRCQFLLKSMKSGVKEALPSLTWQRIQRMEISQRTITVGRFEDLLASFCFVSGGKHFYNKALTPRTDSICEYTSSARW